MNIPEDCKLTYTVPHEAWYRDVVKDQHPHVMVHASAEGGGVAWEFEVQERKFNDGATATRLMIFDDAYAAFEQIPEFFTALREQRPTTLPEVRAILDSLGAVDVTDRDAPTGSKPAPTWSAADIRAFANKLADKVDAGETEVTVDLDHDGQNGEDRWQLVSRRARGLPSTVRRIDPTGCGCTDCLTGYSEPYQRGSKKHRQPLLAGIVQNATGWSLDQITFHVELGER